MTLLLRDEQDIVRENSIFPPGAGVDWVIVTDNGSVPPRSCASNAAQGWCACSNPPTTTHRGAG
jgi:hypothetical protein